MSYLFLHSPTRPFDLFVRVITTTQMQFPRVIVLADTESRDWPTSGVFFRTKQEKEHVRAWKLRQTKISLGKVSFSGRIGLSLIVQRDDR